jgi:transcriptional regulator with XRE-family HTH domain
VCIRKIFYTFAQIILVAGANSELYKKIGEKICELRKDRKLTQDALSHKIDANRATISNIESGKQQISLHLLYRIAAHLNTEIQFFLPSVAEFLSYDKLEEDRLKDELDKQNIDETTRNILLQILNKK